MPIIRFSRLTLLGALVAASCTAPPTVPGQAAGQATLPAAAAANFELKSLYEWAAAHKVELQYMPCSCGCKGLGHTSNYSCFVKENAPDGSVRTYDDHGAFCGTCQAVARDTRDMLAQGKGLKDIRAHVDKAYPGLPTDTPQPPQ